MEPYLCGYNDEGLSSMQCLPRHYNNYRVDKATFARLEGLMPAEQSSQIRAYKKLIHHTFISRAPTRMANRLTSKNDPQEAWNVPSTPLVNCWLASNCIRVSGGQSRAGHAGQPGCCHADKAAWNPPPPTHSKSPEMRGTEMGASCVIRFPVTSCLFLTLKAHGFRNRA